MSLAWVHYPLHHSWMQSESPFYASTIHLAYDVRPEVLILPSGYLTLPWKITMFKFGKPI